jgi:hypothetical protein
MGIRFLPREHIAVNRILVVSLVAAWLWCPAVDGQAQVPPAVHGAQAVDWRKALDLRRRSQRGEKLSREDQAYLDRAQALGPRAAAAEAPAPVSRGFRHESQAQVRRHGTRHRECRQAA